VLIELRKNDPAVPLIHAALKLHVRIREAAREAAHVMRGREDRRT
jgi:hypothetical protein